MHGGGVNTIHHGSGGARVGVLWVYEGLMVLWNPLLGLGRLGLGRGMGMRLGLACCRGLGGAGSVTIRSKALGHRNRIRSKPSHQL